MRGGGLPAPSHSVAAFAGGRMSFDHLPPSKPAPRRVKKEQVFCVGWRAFIQWPQRGAMPAGPVPLVDASGNALPNDLVDGQEVEILSWRPRSREGVSYQIRRLADGSEWWIGAPYLRRQRTTNELGAQPGDATPR
jgi:hypothetical protein